MKETAPNKNRIRRGPLQSVDSMGMNGLFIFQKEYPTSGSKYEIRCIVSDGETTGWEHVSVSLDKKRCPTWEEMCFVKDIFWDEHEVVIQFHPSKSEYVNNHPYCLHLWRQIWTIEDEVKTFNVLEIELPARELIGL